MIRKWLIFSLSAGILVSLASAFGLANADDKDKETGSARSWRKSTSTTRRSPKGLRTKVAFAKAQKDVEKSAKELVKLAKEAKPIKDAVKKAKDVADPGKKWDDWSDEFIKTSENLAGRGQAQCRISRRPRTPSAP